MRRQNAKPETIDDYLALLSADKRGALQKIRQIVRSAARNAEECISYGIPTFKLDGRVIFYFGAAADHCAVYAVPKEFESELADFDTSGKGTMRFEPEHPIPASLVKRIVKTRIERNAAARKKSAKKRISR